MQPLRRWVARIAVAALIAIAMVAPGTPAFATVGVGYSYLYKGPSPGYGFLDWNTNFNTVRLLSNPVALESGKCTDAWFDWHRIGGGHFDSRVARSCLSSSQRDSGTTTESMDLGDMQKAATCYGPNNATITSSQCEQDSRRQPGSEGEITGVNPNLPSTCTRSWRLTSSGSYLYDSGGSSTSCTS